MHRTVSALSVCALLCSLASVGCLDPLTSDELKERRLLLPSGAVVLDAHDDPLIDGQIDANDGVEQFIPLISGFANGEPIKYWDFGETVESAIPIFIVVENLETEVGENEGELPTVVSFDFTSHPSIIDLIPGDFGYSPFWVVYFLEVTPKYNGELITSFGAIEEAQREGLIYAPLETRFAVNCPVVARGTEIEVGDNELGAQKKFFWQGKTVNYFELGFIQMTENISIPVNDIYVLRREGEEPLSELQRGVDITGDDDVFDTNNILDSDKDGNGFYSPLMRTVNVTVKETFVGIDSTRNETATDIKSARQLFNPEPQEIVVSFEETITLRNVPRQLILGGF